MHAPVGKGKQGAKPGRSPELKSAPKGAGRGRALRSGSPPSRPQKPARPTTTESGTVNTGKSARKLLSSTFF